MPSEMRKVGLQKMAYSGDRDEDDLYLAAENLARVRGVLWLVGALLRLLGHFTSDYFLAERKEN